MRHTQSYLQEEQLLLRGRVPSHGLQLLCLLGPAAPQELHYVPACTGEAVLVEWPFLAARSSANRRLLAEGWHWAFTMCLLGEGACPGKQLQEECKQTGKQAIDIPRMGTRGSSNWWRHAAATHT